ncbi:MAG: His/Gly/Thr/Pro-type tRNA ligase C-terminal domain-containing protein, partial [Candidatus Krumholzibacteria bacterium]
RALVGSIERFVGILTEHFAGAFPVWLAPVQVLVLPVAPEEPAYAESVRDRLLEAGVRVALDARNEKIGYRIREAELQKVPYMAVVGKREAGAGTVALRSHGAGDRGSRELEQFVAEVVDEAVPGR